MKRPLCLYCLFFFIAVWLYLMISGIPPSSYVDEAGDTVTLMGRVKAKESSSQNQILYLDKVTISDTTTVCGREQSSKLVEKEEGVICYLREGEMPKLGSFVVLQGKIEEFSRATNPGEFDRRNYYLAKEFGGVLKGATILSYGSTYSYYKEGLWRIRCYLASVLDTIFTKEDASILKAMLLGDRSDLGGEIKELYQTNGIAHILAISGLHISILGMGLYRCMRKLSLAIIPSVLIALFFMVNYAIMTGNSISTLRAVIMFALYIISDICKRSYDLVTALAISAVIVTVTHPYEVLTSSFWLSYLAVFGIAVFYPIITSGVELQNRRWNRLLHCVLSGLCVTLFTLPIILLCYYEFPLYSVFLNLIILPCMSLLLISAIGALFIGCISLNIGVFAAIPSHCILHLYYKLCLLFEQLPYHSYITGCPEWWQIAGFYGIMLFLILRSKKMFLITRVGILLGALFLLFIRVNTGMQITMLDVGQGDGICIREENCVLMIDGGSSDKNNLAKYQLVPFLKHEGITRINYWFLTHPDADHISGILELLQMAEMEISIDTIVLPDAYGVQEDFSEIILLAEEKKIPILYLSAGQEIVTESLCISCLHPTSGYRTEDVNTYSIVLEIAYGTFTGIFTGDATYESERCVMEYWENNGFPEGGIQLLKVGHHGSATSSSSTFLHLMQPQYAWISCGKNNSYGHPNNNVLQLLDEIGTCYLRTDEKGAIIYQIVSNNL